MTKRSRVWQSNILSSAADSRYSFAYAVATLTLLSLTIGMSNSALAITRLWDDAGGTPSKLWSNVTNWNPDGNPDNDDVIVGLGPDAANDRTFFDSNGIDPASLTVTGGADVVNSLNAGASPGFQIDVSGATTVGGVGTLIELYGTQGESLSTGTLLVNDGGQILLKSTPGSGTAVVETRNGAFNINANAEVSGTGRIDLDQPLAFSPPTTLLTNNGLIEAFTPSAFGLAPEAGTLQINASASGNENARFDWDGAVPGNIRVGGNQTLDVDVRQLDAFSGALDLAAGSLLDVEHEWSLDVGTIDASTPAFGFVVVGQDPNPGPAARIDGAGWNMSGGTINVDEAWDTLQFDSQVDATGGSVNNVGTLVFNANAGFGTGVDFDMIGRGPSLVVNRFVRIDTPDFDLDGGQAQGSTTINGRGFLDLNLGTGADSEFNHTINLNGADDFLFTAQLQVTTSSGFWVLANDGALNVAGGGQSIIGGDSVRVLSPVSVTEASELRMAAVATYGSTTVTVDAGSVVDHTSALYLGGNFIGGGTLRPGEARISGNVSFATGSVDLDDGDITVFDLANLNVQTSALDSDGGIDSDITVHDQGDLTLGLTGAADVIINANGSLNYVGDVVMDNFLNASPTGSTLRFDSGAEFNIEGLGSTESRFNLNGGSLNMMTASQGLELRGGSTSPGNTYETSGGAINGPGFLRIATGSALRGHGSLNASVLGDGGSEVIAEGGVMNVEQTVISVGTIGTSGNDAILDFASPWNTNVASEVRLTGGEIRGGQISNDGLNGIRGNGLVSAAIINDTEIASDSGKMLIVDNPNTDWDGQNNQGALRAFPNDGFLEVRDDAPFDFGGTVGATDGTVFVNGFEMSFLPGSLLALDGGGTFMSNADTSIGGTVLIGTGIAGSNPPSKLDVDAVAIFEPTSVATIVGTLELDNSETHVAAGASFTGTGTLKNLANRVLNLADDVEIDVQVHNNGSLEIAGSSVGTVELSDFAQTDSGVLLVEIAGLGEENFDNLAATGAIDVSGDLVVSLVGGYEPTLGDSYTFLSAGLAATGTFASLDVSGAPLSAGLSWAIAYEPKTVTLRVQQALAGDFDLDGDVDGNDFLTWQRNDGTAGGLAAWQNNYGDDSAAPSTTAVPEPGTFLGGALLLLTVFSNTGRRTTLKLGL